MFMTQNNFRKILNLFVLIAALIFLSGCPDMNEQLYPVSEEQYLIGWALHNINDSTPRKLSYSLKEVAKYTYHFNYPAFNSQRFDNVMFWIGPFQFGAGTSWVRFAVPQDRVYYLKGDKVSQKDYYGRDWSFYNLMHINYLTSDDFATQFGLEIAHRELYGLDNPFNAIKPIPGVKEDVYMGTSPFTPTSVVVKDEAISLNDNLLKGYNRKSYLARLTQLSITSCSSEGCETKIIDLPSPTYKIYLDGNLVEEGELTSQNEWNHKYLKHYLNAAQGAYNVEINIPSGYPIFNVTKIKSSFNKNSEANNYQLPVLKHIEFPPSFKANKSLQISLQFEDESIIKNVSMFYKTDLMADWSSLGSYKGTKLVIKDGNVKEINFRFAVAANDGIAEYEIYPISLRSLSVSCKPESQYINKSGILQTWVHGQCLDEENNPIRGIRVELNSRGKFLGAVMTNPYGSFEALYNGMVDKVTANFKGTGVYEPQKK